MREALDTDKVVAVICHGPWLLVYAGVAKGRTLTSYPSLPIDLENAGATWKDEEVVVDGKLITSRNPDDLPAFVEAISEALRLTTAPEPSCGSRLGERPVPGTGQTTWPPGRRWPAPGA